MAKIKLAEFKPKNAKELADAIVNDVSEIAGATVPKLATSLVPHIRSLSASTFQSATLFKQGKITQAELDRATLDQEAYLNSILLMALFSTYVLAQEVLNGVMALIVAAVKSWTGVELNF